MGKSKAKMTPQDFVLLAIDTLVHQVGSNSEKGIHTRMSGFNEAFKIYFGAEFDSIEITQQMCRDKVIAIFGSKGGVMLYRRENIGEKALKRHDEYWRKRDAGEIPKKKKAAPVSGADALSQMQA